MLAVIVAGIILAVLAIFAVLLWVRWRGEVAAMTRRGERVECKVDTLLNYLALEQERREIDAANGRESQ